MDLEKQIQKRELDMKENEKVFEIARSVVFGSRSKMSAFISLSPLTC